MTKWQVCADTMVQAVSSYEHYLSAGGSDVFIPSETREFEDDMDAICE